MLYLILVDCGDCRAAWRSYVIETRDGNWNITDTTT